MGGDKTWQTVVGDATYLAQIIVAAMTTGALFFLVIVLLVQRGQPAAGTQPVLTWIAIAVGVAMMLVRLIVPPRLVARRRAAIARGQFRPQFPPEDQQFQRFLEKAGDAGLLCVVYVNKLLMAGALLEGAAFLALVAYLLEGNPWALGTAVVLIGSLAMMIPRRDAVIAWIEDQLHMLEQERQLLR